MEWNCKLLAEFLFESCESFEVSESSALERSCSCGSFNFFLGSGLTLSLTLCLLFVAGFVFEDAAVREDDALAVFVEFNHLEVELLVNLGGSAVFFNEVFGSCEALNTVGKSDNSTLVEHFDDCAFVNRANGEHCLEYIPGVFFELLVAEAETTVVLVDLKNFHFDFSTNLGEFAGVFDFLCPAEVADVDEAIDTFFNFNEYAEVSEVAHFCCVAAANGIAYFDIFPWVFLELLDAEAHLTLVAVECEDDCFDFVADFEEFLSAAEVLAPRHFAYVDKTLYAGSDFEECAVVSHDNNLALNLVTNFEVGIESIPGVGKELLETESNAFFLVVEIEDNDIEFLVELYDFAGMIYAAPAEVGDVDKTVDTAKVDEHTVPAGQAGRGFR